MTGEWSCHPPSRSRDGCAAAGYGRDVKDPEHVLDIFFAVAGGAIAVVALVYVVREGDGPVHALIGVLLAITIPLLRISTRDYLPTPRRRAED